jgi:DNA-binding MarR family transcriptional regulator
MKIEDAIQQQNFRNEFQKAYINLLFTHGFISNTFREMFSAHDLTSQQFNVLRILRGSKQPLSTQQIRKRMLDRMSDVSRIVDRLVDKKLVHKSTSGFDRRLVEVTITPPGLQMLSKLDKMIDDFENRANVSDLTRMAQLSDLLDEFRDYFHIKKDNAEKD